MGVCQAAESRRQQPNGYALAFSSALGLAIILSPRGASKKSRTPQTKPADVSANEPENCGNLDCPANNTMIDTVAPAGKLSDTRPAATPMKSPIDAMPARLKRIGCAVLVMGGISEYS